MCPQASWPKETERSSPQPSRRVAARRRPGRAIDRCWSPSALRCRRRCSGPRSDGRALSRITKPPLTAAAPAGGFAYSSTGGEWFGTASRPAAGRARFPSKQGQPKLAPRPAALGLEVDLLPAAAADVADRQVPGGAVEREAVGIAQAVGVDLVGVRPAPSRTGCRPGSSTGRGRPAGVDPEELAEPAGQVLRPFAACCRRRRPRCRGARRGRTGAGRRCGCSRSGAGSRARSAASPGSATSGLPAERRNSSIRR